MAEPNLYPGQWDWFCWHLLSHMYSRKERHGCPPLPVVVQALGKKKQMSLRPCLFEMGLRVNVVYTAVIPQLWMWGQEDPEFEADIVELALFQK